MPSKRGIQVIEVNGVAAWQGLQRVTGFDIARSIVDDLLDRKLAGARSSARSTVSRQA
jgi:glutathione synthase/RimK-type ligase-like ATP-grasp enzyme